jgi:hypothetical protein
MHLGPAKCSDLKPMECERNSLESLECQRKFVGQEVHLENGDRLALYQRIRRTPCTVKDLGLFKLILAKVFHGSHG